MTIRNRSLLGSHSTLIALMLVTLSVSLRSQHAHAQGHRVPDARTPTRTAEDPTLDPSVTQHIPELIPAGAPITERGQAPTLHANFKDGFGARATDGSFSLRLGALLSFRNGITFGPDQDVTPSTTVNLTRVYLRGNLLKEWVTYYAKAELAGANGPQLLDAYANIAPMDGLQLRVGQFRTPFSRQAFTSQSALHFTERSIASDYFRAGRDTGLMLQGAPFGGTLEYYAGIFNGNGINAGGNENPELLSVGRVVWNPCGAFAYDETVARKAGPPGISLGVNAFHDRLGRTHRELDPNSGILVTVPDPDLVRSTLGVDIAGRAGPLWATVEAYVDFREVTGPNNDSVAAGGFAQAGVTVVPETIEIVACTSVIAPDTEHSDLHGVQRYDLGGNYYVKGNNLKAQMRYSYTHADPGVAGLPSYAQDGHEVIAQLQMAL